VRSIIILSWIALTIASAADARGHRRTHPAKPATQSAQADDKTAAEKVSSDTDETLEKRIKSICRGC
jgi:hypothetical protein